MSRNIIPVRNTQTAQYVVDKLNLKGIQAYHKAHLVIVENFKNYSFEQVWLMIGQFEGEWIHEHNSGF